MGCFEVDGGLATADSPPLPNEPASSQLAYTTGPACVASSARLAAPAAPRQHAEPAHG